MLTSISAALGARRALAAALAVIVLFVALSTIGWVRWQHTLVLTGDIFAVKSDRSMVGISNAKVGEEVIGGLFSPKVHGDKPIHVERIELTGVPKGLIVDHIYAIRESRYAPLGYGTPMARHESGMSAAEVALFQPVNSVTLYPDCPAAAHCWPPPGMPSDGSLRSQDWFFLAELHITRPGDFVTSGERIYYEIGGQQYMQQLDNFVIQVDHGNDWLPMPDPPAPQPLSCHWWVCLGG